MTESLLKYSTQVSWLSAYLYYKGPLDIILRNIVKPFMDEVHGQGIHQFFFIRYYENGSHIRLRLKSDEYTLEAYVKPRLIQVADDFYSATVNIDHASIQFTTYEQELERYGGLLGTQLAERIFQVSSEIVLQIVSQPAWNFQKALGAALQLNVVFLFFFFKNVDEIKGFVALEHRSWLEVSLGNYETKENRDEEINGLLREQERIYRKQCNNVNEVLANVWIRLQNDGSFNDKNMDRWKKAIAEVSLEFERDQVEIIANSTMATTGFGSSDYPNSRWLIFDSYIHMTNNRLGLLYRDESYIYYMLKGFFSTRF